LTDRRLIIAALAACVAGPLWANDEAARPRHKISEAQLRNALAAKFPVRLGLVGLLEVQISAPRLLLLPARNLLGASLRAQVGGLQVPQARTGELDLAFALRYEASDQTVRAHRPEVLDMRWPGVPPETVQALRGVLPQLMEHVGEVVLHKLSPRDLALADTMGFEPEEIQVADDGVVIFFGPKPRR
jgi:hypothetical protein